MASKGKLPEDSARRRVQDVLGQARAALRMSQQFRTKDDRNNNLSSRLAFQQQPHEPDYWSSIAEPEKREPDKSSTYPHDQDGFESRRSTKPKKYDDFGPFGPQAQLSVGKKKAISITNPLPTHHGKRRSSFGSQVSSSSSVSMNTNDLMVSDSDGDSDSERSIASIKRASTGKKPVTPSDKHITTPAPSLVTHSESIAATSSTKSRYLHEDEDKLIPLPEEEDGTTAVPPSATTDETPEEVDQEHLTYDQILSMKQTVTGDPHWFEKALLIRGETISDAAYKAFKKVHAEQEAQQEKIMRELERLKQTSVFNPLMDPEYSADWISDATSTRVQSEVDMPVSELVVQELDDDDDDDDYEIEMDANTISHSDTATFIRTATELEEDDKKSLKTITENLQSVLDISEMPESQDFTQMSEEEEMFAKEYDEAMLNKNEPLQSIFANPEEEQSNESTMKGTGTPGSPEQIDRSGINLETGDTGDDVDGNEDTLAGEEEYDSTFLTTKSSKRQSSKSQSFSVTGGKSKELSSKSKTKTGSVIPSTKSKSKSASAPTISTSKSKSSSVAASAVSSFKRKSSLPPGQTLEPPSTRQQKNIQNILEKEVYEKELRRLRTEKLKEERDTQRLKKLAKKSLEDNKKVIYKEPDYTEILLPELFKYKSVSGLQAAKAKRAHRKVASPTTINYGAPYFSTSGAVSSANNYGIHSMAAQVDSLDIPDLVREVLASNERMYKMTVEASEQMAKTYRDKVRAKASKNRHR
ncbi:unnamed protein product [Orchesella dallaii]|uniref:Uncharacterized protein n=1 Tax=Orchesella dallaii TaxID=48710 RepID=A0ABP1RT80_9HEXA